MIDKEPPKGLNLEKLALDVRLRYLRVSTKFNQVLRDALYRASTPQEQKVRAEKMITAYAAEFIDFLGTNMTEKVSALHLDKAQVQVLQFLVDQAHEGKLLETSTEGSEFGGERKDHLLKKKYESIEKGDETASEMERLLHTLSRKRKVSLSLTWNVTRDFPFNAYTMGAVGSESAEAIRFVFFPEKPETASDLTEVFLRPLESEQKLGVYAKGDRLVRDITSQSDGQQVTEQYYYLGSFEGSDTGKTYYVYGLNYSKHEKSSIKDQVREMNPAFETGTVK